MAVCDHTLESHLTVNDIVVIVFFLFLMSHVFLCHTCIHYRERFANQAYGKSERNHNVEMEVELDTKRVIRGSEDSKPPSKLVRIDTIDL